MIRVKYVPKIYDLNKENYRWKREITMPRFESDNPEYVISIPHPMDYKVCSCGRVVYYKRVSKSKYVAECRCGARYIRQLKLEEVKNG